MKRITMTCRDDRGVVTIEETFDQETNWPAIAYTFKKFLSGMGYNPPEDAVGECVESYVDYAADQGDVW